MSLKLVIVGRRRPGTTLAEHRHHIRHVHGELVLRYIAEEPAVAPQRYVQHQVIDGQYRATPVGSDAFALNRDFVTLIWADDFAALGRSRETAFYRDHLKGDEDNFVDQATVMFMPTREREVANRGGAAPGGYKLFHFIQKSPGADVAEFMRAWADAAAALHAGPLASVISRHVQNEVLPKPGPPSTVDGIDEFWLADEAAARTLLKTWQATLSTALAGLAVDAGSFGLIALEAVLYAGPTPSTSGTPS